MNIQQLRYFLTLADKGNYSKAADCLYITQQGLNMAISNLENEFSCRLFRRGTNGLELTEDGQYFKVHAERILQEVGMLIDHFENQVDGNTVHVAACQGTLSEFIARMLLDFERDNPDTRVSIREYMERNVDNEVFDERAEFGFNAEPFDSMKFETIRIFSCPLVLVMHKDHPLAKLDRIPTEALIGQNLIVLDEKSKTADAFLKECARQGVKITPKFSVSEIFSVHRLAIQKIGVGLSNLAVAPSLDTSDAVYRLFENENFAWNICIFKKRNATLSKNAKRLFDYAQDQIIALP